MSKYFYKPSFWPQFAFDCSLKQIERPKWSEIALIKVLNHFLLLIRGRKGGRHDDESDNHEEDHHMTEAQKEEEQLIKSTFQFYERNKSGT